MFKYRRYTMRFRKQVDYKHGEDGKLYWKEINDTTVVSTLVRLQEKYDFKVIKADINSYHYFSYIVIKCKKEDKYKIFADFCELLDGLIEEISI